jgi:hypothetical protein
LQVGLDVKSDLLSNPMVAADPGALDLVKGMRLGIGDELGGQPGASQLLVSSLKSNLIDKVNWRQAIPNIAWVPLFLTIYATSSNAVRHDQELQKEFAEASLSFASLWLLRETQQGIFSPNTLPSFATFCQDSNQQQF